ncbi:MAG TPA: hypothetical protein VN641_09775 [Urbifossiella sp.]|nr:hypothetical protein [Urbifossiella sp.]
MNRYCLGVGIDDPHDRDAAVKVFFDGFDDVLVLVVRREHFHGEERRAVHEARFLLGCRGLFRSSEGNIDPHIYPSSRSSRIHRSWNRQSSRFSAVNGRSLRKSSIFRGNKKLEAAFFVSRQSRICRKCHDACAFRDFLRFAAARPRGHHSPSNIDATGDLAATSDLNRSRPLAAESRPLGGSLA